MKDSHNFYVGVSKPGLFVAIQLYWNFKLYCFYFFSKFCTSKLGVRLIYGCGFYMDVYGMPSSRIRNPSTSQFHLVLTKLTELQEKLNTTDYSSVIAQLRWMNNSLQIVEGNQTDISDAILNKLLSMEMRIKTGFKALE